MRGGGRNDPLRPRVVGYMVYPEGTRCQDPASGMLGPTDIRNHSGRAADLPQ